MLPPLRDIGITLLQAVDAKFSQVLCGRFFFWRYECRKVSLVESEIKVYAVGNLLAAMATQFAWIPPGFADD